MIVTKFKKERVIKKQGENKLTYRCTGWTGAFFLLLCIYIYKNCKIKYILKL